MSRNAVNDVTNLNPKTPWEANQSEIRAFSPFEHWMRALATAGLTDMGHRIARRNDPTANILMGFKKT